MNQQDPTHLSDDDIAASLGFHTTLSEPLIPQDAGTDQSAEAGQTTDQSGQTTPDARNIDTPASPNVSHDDRQDAELEDIKNQLNELQKGLEKDGQKESTTKDSGTAG